MKISEKFNSFRRLIWIYVCSLIGLALILGILHVFYGDLRLEGVKWFHLDKERNIPTWYSGLLLFLFGCAALWAYYSEQKINEDHQLFRFPQLWLGVGLIGFILSLDEITILHENLFWREVRQITDTGHPSFKYFTQWQILFAPAILLLILYFVILFTNRYQASKTAKRTFYWGIACWLMALFLESIRTSIKNLSDILYSAEVVFEEVSEMVGTILLLASILFYTLEIALAFDTNRREILIKSII